MRRDQAVAYVESLIEDLIGSDHVQTDDDGDWPLRFGATPYYVRVTPDRVPIVRVFAPVVRNVEGSPELFERINWWNRDIRFARLAHEDTYVNLWVDLLADSIDPASFRNACDAVAYLARDIAPDLAQRFGGELAEIAAPDEASAADALDPDPQHAGTGMYL